VYGSRNEGRCHVRVPLPGTDVDGTIRPDAPSDGYDGCDGTETEYDIAVREDGSARIGIAVRHSGRDFETFRKKYEEILPEERRRDAQRLVAALAQSGRLIGDVVADENPEAFAAYEATFPAKEKTLLPNQLPQFCQSCGMPLTKNEDCGTNADGSICFDYCKYCYQDGKFLQDCTMDEMIEHCAQFVDEVNKNLPQPMTREEYVKMMRSFFPMLKRWKQ
jgi:hypothetical protein